MDIPFLISLRANRLQLFASFVKLRKQNRFGVTDTARGTTDRLLGGGGKEEQR